jgi:hypothetical protein
MWMCAAREDTKRLPNPSSHAKYKCSGLLLLLQRTLLRTHCCSTEQDERSVNSNEKTLEFRHMVYDRYYQVYTTYWARTRTRVAPTENGPEADVSLAFIGLSPCSNSNCTFKPAACTPSLHQLISGIPPDCCRIMTRFFKTRLKLRAVTQSNEQDH